MKFKHTRMQTKKLQIRLQREPSFIECFRNDVTDDFWDDILSKDQAILVISGEVGTLKSSIGIKLCSSLSKTFRTRHIGFCDTDILNISKASKEGDAFMRDEDPKEFGEGTGRVSSQVLILQETLRQRKNHLVFISPLARNIPTAHYIIETIDCTHTIKEMEKMKQGDHVYVRCGIREPRTEGWIGYAIFKIPLYDKTWGGYQVLKKAWLEGVKGMNFGKEDYERIAEEVAKKFLKEEKDLERFKKNNGSWNKGRIDAKLRGSLRNEYTTQEIKNIMQFLYDFFPDS